MAQGDVVIRLRADADELIADFPIMTTPRKLWEIVYQVAGAATAGYWKRSGEVFYAEEVSQAVRDVMQDHGFDPPPGYREFERTVEAPDLKPVESDADLLERMGSDPMKWAEEFIRTIRQQDVDPTDPGFMVGWFANAMEAGKRDG